MKKGQLWDFDNSTSNKNSGTTKCIDLSVPSFQLCIYCMIFAINILSTHSLNIDQYQNWKHPYQLYLKQCIII
jgi:hypothetical protein